MRIDCKWGKYEKNSTQTLFEVRYEFVLGKKSDLGSSTGIQQVCQVPFEVSTFILSNQDKRINLIMKLATCFIRLIIVGTGGLTHSSYYRHWRPKDATKVFRKWSVLWLLGIDTYTLWERASVHGYKHIMLNGATKLHRKGSLLPLYLVFNVRLATWRTRRHLNLENRVKSTTPGLYKEKSVGESVTTRAASPPAGLTVEWGIALPLLSSP